MKLITILCVLIAVFCDLSPSGRMWLVIILLPFVCCCCFAFTAKNISVPLKKALLHVVLLASVILLLLGIYPTMYYLDGVFFFMIAWLGIMIVWLSLSACSLKNRDSSKAQRSVNIDCALVAIPILTGLMLGFQVPMRMATFAPLSMLENKLEELEVAPVGTIRCGPYLLRTPAKRRGNRLCFLFTSDGDSYFVYCPNPINRGENNPVVGRNPGSEGHLFGDWYWVKDD